MRTQQDSCSFTVCTVPYSPRNSTDKSGAWLRSHPDHLTDQRKAKALHIASQQAHYMGVTPDGNPSQFLQHVEDALRRMGSLPQAPVSAPAHDDSPLSPERYVPGRETVESVSKYSAPVSRETPSGDYSRRYSNTSTTLTQEERQLARSFGLSETEYAVQKLRLPHYKAVRGDEGSR